MNVVSCTKFLLIVPAAVLLVALCTLAWSEPVSLPGWKVSPDESKGQIITSGGKTVLKVRCGADDDQRASGPPIQLAPGGCYQLRFTSRTDTPSGLVTFGAREVRGVASSSHEPSRRSFTFRVSTKPQQHALTLGAYNLGGEVEFSDVEFLAVQPVHTKKGTLTLGDGERLEAGKYTDRHIFGWQGSTIHRTLHEFDGEFNTDRWWISPHTYLIYRYDMPFNLQNGQVQISCGYYLRGSVQVGASVDGENYHKIGELTGVSSGSFDIPSDLLPAGRLFVKLVAGVPDTALQVHSYSLSADTDYQGADVIGGTLLVSQEITSDNVEAGWSQDKGEIKVTWKNKTSANISALVATGVDGKFQNPSTLNIPANGTAATIFSGSNRIGRHNLAVRLSAADKVLYEGDVDIVVTSLTNDDYGYRLASRLEGVDIWWCESDWKVSPNRAVPNTKTDKPVSLSAAKGEHEGVQIVLSPGEYGFTINDISIDNLTGTGGSIGSENVRFYEVATVRVTTPTDYLGQPGEYPDPIPPFEGKLAVSRDHNQSILVSVRVPESANAGIYDSKITIKTSKGTLSVPLQLRVYDFVLPQQPTLQSALGIYESAIRSYNKPQNEEQFREIMDKWLKNFAEHRISPYHFAPYAPIGFSIVGEPGDRRVVLDWTEFDKAAERFLDGYKLSSFQLPIRGLGGGTYHDRYVGEMDGHKAGSPEYEWLMADYLGQLENHLREKGWLSKAYVYWFDEPEEKDYPFVIDVMERIKKYAPDIRRLLTEQPEPPLYGHVDIWCGLTNLWTQKAIKERIAAGEDVWWYICTGPKAPYVGEFIDHPGGELRLWIWQTWQYDVRGILIWTTNWWNSAAAFPDSLQDPWEDPMSYVDGYSTPKGTKSPWGNGDGRFLYPPRRDPNTATDPDLSAPISSLRWESLRDGMEDYEYFVILQRLLHDKAEVISEELKTEAEGLLVVPEEVSKDLTTFTTDPRLILQHREKIATMIERLKKL